MLREEVEDGSVEVSEGQPLIENICCVILEEGCGEVILGFNDGAELKAGEAELLPEEFLIEFKALSWGGRGTIEGEHGKGGVNEQEDELVCFVEANKRGDR